MTISGLNFFCWIRFSVRIRSLAVRSFIHIRASLPLSTHHEVRCFDARYWLEEAELRQLPEKDAEVND